MFKNTTIFKNVYLSSKRIENIRMYKLSPLGCILEHIDDKDQTYRQIYKAESKVCIYKNCVFLLTFWWSDGTNKTIIYDLISSSIFIGWYVSINYFCMFVFEVLVSPHISLITLRLNRLRQNNSFTRSSYSGTWNTTKFNTRVAASLSNKFFLETVGFYYGSTFQLSAAQILKQPRMREIYSFGFFGWVNGLTMNEYLLMRRSFLEQDFLWNGSKRHTNFFIKRYFLPRKGKHVKPLQNRYEIYKDLHFGNNFAWACSLT